MKYLLYILSIVLVLSCNKEDANDCFQTSGPIVTQNVVVSDFERILVNRGVTLFLSEGAEHSVIVESGKNLINDVQVSVINNRLIVSDNNTCNFVRDYGLTKIYVTAPNISEIRSSTQYDITSLGTLNYPNLELFSEDFNGGSEYTVGDFRLDVNMQTLDITSNNLASFFINGTVDTLEIGFFSGSGRLEGANLIAQNVDVYHRGENDIIINPQQELTGRLVSTGNVIAKTFPPVVDVEVLFSGQLLFQ